MPASRETICQGDNWEYDWVSEWSTEWAIEEERARRAIKNIEKSPRGKKNAGRRRNDARRQ